MTAQFRAPDAVVFDVGGVLLDWDPRHLYRRLFSDAAAMDHFLAEICSPAWHRWHDLGVDTAESCAALAAQHPEHAEEILAWAERNDEMLLGPIEGAEDLLVELARAGVARYLLSNMEPETFPDRVAAYPFLAAVDGQVISGLEGVAKPDPAIFELLLARYGLDADRCLFVDDRQENVAVAARLGFATVAFTSIPALRDHLVGLGLLRAVRPTS